MSLKNCRSALAGSHVMNPETPARVDDSWDTRFLTAGLPRAVSPQPPRGRGVRAEPTACASDEAVGSAISGRS